MSFYPFRQGDTYSTFRAHLEKTISEIRELDNNYVLKASQSELEDYYFDRVHINPLILNIGAKYIQNQSSVGVDVSNDFTRAVMPGERAVVPGTRLDIAIPFEGDELLWKLQPSRFSLGGYPEIDVQKTEVIISFIFPDDNAESKNMQATIDGATKSIEDAVENIRHDVDQHNSSAPNRIRQTIAAKREIAEKTVGAITALGIPVKRREEPLAYTVPTRRRQVPISRPRVSTEPYQPEYLLDQAEYQHILGIMRSMSVVIERNPSAFANLKEEDIRTHFLLQLNGHYEGTASGETFNASGKTDILIRVEDRNIFIAECKFWKGPKSFDAAIEQLLSYLSWRDAKCALLVFNRTRDSTAVLEKMNDVVEARPEHKRTSRHEDNVDSSYILVKESDPGREIILTTQLYDFPVPEDKDKS